jgi:uncharacterized protein (TIGR02145 family)
MIGYLNNIIQRIPVYYPTQGYYLRWYYNGWHYWFFIPGTITTTTQGEKYRTLGNKNVSISTGQITREQAKAIRCILHTREIELLTDVGWKSVKIENSTVVIYDSLVTGVQIDFDITIGSRVVSNTGYTRIPNIVPIIPAWITDTVCINGQLWTQKNYNALYPSSKVYNDDELNRATYGGLYTWDQVTAAGFVPEGFHLPSLAEATAMRTFLGSGSGNKLKEAGTTHWNTVGGTDDYSFKALGAGSFISDLFVGLGVVGNFWLSDSSGEYGYYLHLQDSDSESEINLVQKTSFLSVRFIANTPCNPNLVYGFLYNWFAAKGIARPAFSDYYLPSKDELNKMYTNLHLFGLGNFINMGYWSSTESSIYPYGYAWSQSFITGNPANGIKIGYFYVRACRSFITDTPYSIRDIGPSGGYIFDVVDNGDGTYTNYESSAYPDVLVTWSNIYNATVGTTGSAVGTGRANTLLIISQSGHVNSAAKSCNDLVF